jgi:hypothetical protein
MPVLTEELLLLLGPLIQSPLASKGYIKLHRDSVLLHSHYH